MPVRSRILGSIENTDGTYPLEAGGSPVANPISRCAIAKRVKESISKSTFFPSFLKPSEISVARTEALILMGAG